jgi:hypothetical protein
LREPASNSVSACANREATLRRLASAVCPLPFPQIEPQNKPLGLKWAAPALAKDGRKMLLLGPKPMGTEPNVAPEHFVELLPRPEH